jgi:Spy/CpxP family protein refolding chaperone
MKQAILAVLFFVTISVGAHAQGRGGQGERMSSEKRAEMQTQRMKEQLGLTDEQQKKVLALHVERNKKFETASREDESKRKEMREAYVKDLNAILTPEQQVKLKEIQKDGRGAREGANNRSREERRPSKPRN